MKRLQTYLTHETVRKPLKSWPDDRSESGYPQWRTVLELLGDLVGRPGMHVVLPDEDTPRVREIVMFWRLIGPKPLWFEKTLQDLAQGLERLR